MGCSTLCRASTENIVIKSKVNKDFLNNEPDIDNNSQKVLHDDKQIENNIDQNKNLL